jgi:phage minor structural protein
MRFIFFGMDDSLLFVRDDAESASWSVKGMQLNVDFPYIAEKEITRGMRVGFVDEDGVLQPFEIRRVKLYEPDHYQEVYAEHIAIAELTDEFYQGSDATDITPDIALETILTGTLWEVGTCTADNESTVDLDKGTVWNDVRNIEQNWNVWITPRVTFDDHGITGRYLDIVPAVGVWRGVTLSINGNADEMGVTVDDSETVTAVYGLGGTPPTKSGTEGDAITFAEVVWEATEDHPAKPSGQTYIEDPAALALYGRNGRNRFSYYQNGDIKTPELLLQKSWEYLQTVNKPRVTV